MIWRRKITAMTTTAAGHASECTTEAMNCKALTIESPFYGRVRTPKRRLSVTPPEFGQHLNPGSAGEDRVVSHE